MNYNNVIHIACQFQHPYMHVDHAQNHDYKAMHRAFASLNMAAAAPAFALNPSLAERTPNPDADGCKREEQMSPNKRLKMGE